MNDQGPMTKAQVQKTSDPGPCALDLGPSDVAVLHTMWVALLEWFGALGHKSITAQEARIWGCIDARWCANLGWLTRDAARHCFTPAGELAAELELLRSPSPQPSPPGEGDESSVQCTPTSGVAGADHDAAPAASPTTNATATAPAVAVLSPLGPCALDPGPSASGRWDVAPTGMPRADQLQGLGQMRECVQLLAEEIEAGWQLIIQAQQQEGWPDFDKIQDATHALHRATTDLDNLTHEMMMKLAWRPRS